MKMPLVLCLLFFSCVKRYDVVVRYNDQFEKYFIKNAKKNGVIEDLSNLQRDGKVLYIPKEDRVRVGRLQLSFEQAIADCFKDKYCISGKSIIHTPNPATPLRIGANDVAKISGTNNLDINYILLSRKSALLSYLSEPDTKLNLSYQNLTYLGIESYNDVKNKFAKNIIDCSGCYGFTSDESFAQYSIKNKNGKTIKFAVYQNQLQEDNNKKDVRVEYVIL